MISINLEKVNHRHQLYIQILSSKISLELGNRVVDEPLLSLEATPPSYHSPAFNGKSDSTETCEMFAIRVVGINEGPWRKAKGRHSLQLNFVMESTKCGLEIPSVSKKDVRVEGEEPRLCVNLAACRRKSEEVLRIMDNVATGKHE
jgi:hypothetical protein